MKKVSCLAMGLALAFLLPVASTFATPAEETKQEDHMHHDGGSDPYAWRMPPHDFPMPMMPGLEGAVPIVGPFLPGMDARPSTCFPRPSRQKSST